MPFVVATARTFLELLESAPFGHTKAVYRRGFTKKDFSKLPRGITICLDESATFVTKSVRLPARLQEPSLRPSATRPRQRLTLSITPRQLDLRKPCATEFREDLYYRFGRAIELRLSRRSEIFALAKQLTRNTTRKISEITENLSPEVWPVRKLL